MGAEPMPGEEDDGVDIARKALLASRQTTAAVEALTAAIQDNRGARDREAKQFREAIRELRDILVGVKGDNGLTSRVLILEKAKGNVSWQSVGVIFALGMAALGMYLN